MVLMRNVSHSHLRPSMQHRAARAAALALVASFLLAVAALGASVAPKPGKYAGSVESVFTLGLSVASNGKQVRALQTDFQAPCGVLSPNKVTTRFPALAIRNGRFRGSKHGLTITGHFTAPAVISGTVAYKGSLAGFTKKPRACKGSFPFTAKPV
jgi:hypothetical protein